MAFEGLERVFLNCEQAMELFWHIHPRFTSKAQEYGEEYGKDSE